MQTFLPSSSFQRTAQLLDDRRLGKQRVEALQVLRAMRIPGYGWRNHPAVRMWRRHREALVAYGVAICREWMRRGFADTVLPQLLDELDGREPRSQRELRAAGELPPWLGTRAFHLAHRSALVRKDPQHYRRFFPDVPDDLPYVWPVDPG